MFLIILQIGPLALYCLPFPAFLIVFRTEGLMDKKTFPGEWFPEKKDFPGAVSKEPFTRPF